MNNIDNEENKPRKSFSKRPLSLLVLCFLILVFVGMVYFNFEKNKNSTSINNLINQDKWQYFQNLGYINDIVFDDNEDIIWLAANGIHKFSQSQNKIVKSYNVSDGLLSNQIFGLEKIGTDLYYITKIGIGKINLKDDTTSKVYEGTIPGKELSEGESTEIHGFVPGLDYDGKNLIAQTTLSLKKFNLETKNWETFDYDFRAGMSQQLSLKKSVELGDKIFTIYNRQLWEMDETNKKWVFDPSVVIKDGTAGIESNGKYIVIGPPFNFYHKEPAVLYYRKLTDSKWNTATLPFPDQDWQGTRYGGMSIDKDDNIYFIDDLKYLVVYNLETKNLKKYPLGFNVEVGNSLSDIRTSQTYVDLGHKRVLFPSMRNNFMLTSVDLVSEKVTGLIDRNSIMFYGRILATRQGKALIETDKGCGILTAETNDFKLISRDYPICNGDAKWVDDGVIWLNLSSYQEYGSNYECFDEDCGEGYIPPTDLTFTLGKYNVKNDSLERKDFIVKNDTKESVYRTQLLDEQKDALLNKIYFVDSQNKLRLADFLNGTLQTISEGHIAEAKSNIPSNKEGMMSANFDQSITDDKCIWYSKELEGIWRYCQE